MNERDVTTLLIDMYVAEAKLNMVPIKHDSALSLFLPFEESYMKKHKISNEALRKTYRYYLDHPAVFEKIYDAVIDSLTLREKHALNKKKLH
jgi:hypothetical protein